MVSRLRFFCRLSCCVVVLASGGPESVVLAANGCAPGTLTTTHSPDGEATSFLFDDFHVISDKSRGPTRAKCDLAAPVKTRKGFSVFAVDYRGFVTKNADQSVSIRRGSETIYDPTGRITRDFAISRRMGTVDGRQLELSIRLAANGNPGDLDPAELYLDTIDVAQIGFTTMESVRGSLDEVALQRRDLMNRMQSISNQMLGFSDPFAGDDYIAGFTGVNASTGFTARWNATDELTLRAGLSLADLGGTETDADNPFLFASSARYAVPLDGVWTVFGELGGWASPDVEASYRRSYLDGTRLASTLSRASGSMLGGSARIGMVMTPDTQNEFVLSARLSRSIFNVDAYSEKATDDNLFAASMSGSRSNLDAADITLAWTHSLTSAVDYSLIASGGREFANRHAVSADVDWVGKADGGWEAAYFGSLGARLGWQFRDNWSIDTTAQADFRASSDPQWDVEIRLKTEF